MRVRRPFFLALYFFFFASALPAQLPPVKTDPLHPTQTIQGSGACSVTKPSSCAQAAAKITPIVMGDSPLEANLRHLTDDIGGRVTGSAEMSKAVDWAIAAFRAGGVDVRTEKYTLPHAWSEGATKLDVLGPLSFPVSLVSVGLSPATPEGGIEAPLVFIGNGTEADFLRAGASLKGAILLVHLEVSYTWEDLLREYDIPPPIIDRAAKAGAAAILWTGERERKLLYRHTNSPDGRLEALPQAILAREDGLRLERTALAYPGKIKLRLTMPNRITGPGEQQNVAGEIRGYEKPDEIVVLGAHLDSWELGTGTLDNGCNAAMVIEAARAIKASGLLPRRTIRFILFSGEEQGLLGSWAYVRAHRAELDKYRGVIIFDSGIGRVTGYSLGGRHDIETAIQEILKPFAGWGVETQTLDATTGTDNLDFLLEGVPTLVANQEVANYLQNYHAASDTFDKVDIRELKLNTVLAAVTAWGIADRVEPIGKRQSRAELEALMKETGLDKELKALDMWSDFQSGARGRQPQ
ncbi:MAG TPA: M20/M25/M40 family metallo-hydrolase [Candidatus Acidoferrales bacterium]|jgi:carboxypeptidase Q|nr:M20/M25/M40 family metallo-hydrolase [Candidatus Acidoferrales bacterium]